MDPQELQNKISDSNLWVEAMRSEMGRVLVGQKNLVNKLLIGLLSNGHILLEGVPGLAKTLAVKALAGSLKAEFARIQFTPDLLPADLLGTMIYHPDQKTFAPKLGPIFANLILADEINRAPAKVQSALLEAMQEQQVTIGDQSYDLPSPFLVLATQNPIDQEGTYSLPEAQLDRFLLKITVDYPSREEELDILDR
ncbi:AAA family ATPase, partial [bacterium]|nr:AAA family ATPase [bacterium]